MADDIPPSISDQLDLGADAVLADELQSESEDDDPDTCEVEMTNGEVCGRDLPCQYHGGD